MSDRERPFNVEQHPITSREEWLCWRKRDITASAAAALLGAHPFLSAYSIWAEKTGAIAAEDEMTAAMERGIELEPLAVKRLAKMRPEWTVSQPNCYYRDPVARLGATPDAFAHEPQLNGFGVVQIKSVEPGIFRKKWRNEDGEIEPPTWIVVQALIEAHLTGARWAAVAALVVSYGIELYVVDIPLHEGIIERIRAETAAFWRLVESGAKPDPDWMRDGRLIERLYQPTGEIIDLSADNQLPELLDEREGLMGIRKASEERLREIRVDLLARLGGASMATVADGRTITAKRVERKGYVVEPSSYMDVRVRKGRI